MVQMEGRIFKDVLQTVPQGPGFYAVGDLNGDGKDDVAYGEANLQTYISNGDGSFTPKTIFTMPNQTINTGMMIDSNHDGKAEIVVTSRSQLAQYQRDASGDWILGLYSAGMDPATLAQGDLDLDGKLDIIYASPGGVSLPDLLIMYGK
jgi:hypothetical protein